jgi:hypothetical protein
MWSKLRYANSFHIFKIVHQKATTFYVGTLSMYKGFTWFARIRSLTRAKFVNVSQYCAVFFVRHANALTGIVRVAIARCLFLRIIYARHKNYNLADFSPLRNSYTDKVKCMLQPYGEEKSTKSLNRYRIKTSTRTKIYRHHAANFYNQKNWFYIESQREFPLLKNRSFLRSDFKNLNSVA